MLYADSLYFIPHKVQNVSERGRESKASQKSRFAVSVISFEMMFNFIKN